MFFQGTLQEGIATALQQTKQVLCFVTDEGDESQQWEDEFLTDDSIKGNVESQTVALRLKAGSEEAGYLEAMFPVPRKPTLILIRNGQLRDYITAGTQKEEFIRRLGAALEPPSIQPSHAPAPQNLAQNQPSSVSATQQPIQEDSHDLYGNDSSASPQPVASALPSASLSENPQVQAMLHERSKRLEADKQAKEAKAEKAAKAKERREAESAAAPATAESSYAKQLKKRRQEERDERQRILRRIEDDKRERKEREALEKQARLLLNATQDGDDAGASPAATEPPIPLSTRGSSGANCNLQVRLLDGSTLRTQFPSVSTIQSDVRKWIDENRSDGDNPYTFRVVLTPMPNKAIEPSEESQTLLSLGLAPSATLVLIPKVRFAAAYAAQGGNILWRGWAFVYAMVATLFGLPGLLFRGREGREAQHQQQQQQQYEEVPLDNLDGSGAARQRIRGFQNQNDRRRDPQFYNGNSLSFEPRRDEDESTD